MNFTKTILIGIKTWIEEKLSKKVDKVDNMGLSTNDYTTEDKNKLAGVEKGATKTIIDSSLSDSSQNPVQNQVVAKAINELNISTNEKFTNLVGTESVSYQINAAIDNIVDVNDIDIVTPDMFGAIGDGTTDDSAALQAMFDYASEHECCMYFPVSKIYIVNSTIYLNSGAIYRMRSDNISTNAESHPNIRTGSNDMTVFAGKNYESLTEIGVPIKMHCEGMSFRGYGATCFKGISFSGSRFIGCTFQQFGIWLEGGLHGDNKVTNCTFMSIHTCVLCGYVLKNSVGFDPATWDFSEEDYYFKTQSNDNTFFTNNYIAGAKARKNYIIVGTIDEDFYISNCWIEFFKAIQKIDPPSDITSWFAPNIKNCILQLCVTFVETTKDISLQTSISDSYFMSWKDDERIHNKLDEYDVCAPFSSMVRGKKIYWKLILTDCIFKNCDKSATFFNMGNTKKQRIDARGYMLSTGSASTQEFSLRDRRNNVRLTDVFLADPNYIQIDAPITIGSECPYETVTFSNPDYNPEDASNVEMFSYELYVYGRNDILVYNDGETTHQYRYVQDLNRKILVSEEITNRASEDHVHDELSYLDGVTSNVQTQLNYLLGLVGDVEVVTQISAAISNMDVITEEEIDEICGATIYAVNEVKF